MYIHTYVCAYIYKNNEYIIYICIYIHMYVHTYTKIMNILYIYVYTYICTYCTSQLQVQYHMHGVLCPHTGVQVITHLYMCTHA